MRVSRLHIIAIAISAALGGCDKVDLDFGGGRQQDWADIDESILTTSGGEVELADGRRFPFSVTSERFRAWDVAQSSLPRSTAERFGDLLEPENPSEASIQSAIDFLESDQSARESIERAGLSVRDFVLTTVLLEQEMRLATGEGRQRQPPLPMPPLDTYDPNYWPVDTFTPTPPPQPLPTYTPPPTYTPVPYTPVPYTPPTPVTPTPTPVSPAPTPVPPTVTPRDTIRPLLYPRTDTAARPRDTVRTLPQPVPVPVVPAPTPTPVPRDTSSNPVPPSPAPTDTSTTSPSA